MNCLPGWFPGVKGSGPPTTSLSFHASVVFETVNATLPATIQAGDLIVAFNWAVSNGPAPVTPSGFTSIVSATDGGVTVHLLCAIAQASDASRVISGMDGSSGESWLIYVFRGNNPITALNIGDFIGEATDGDPVGRLLDVDGDPVPMVVVAGYASSGPVSPRSFSPTKDGEINATSVGDQWLAYKIFNASPADVSIDMADEGNDNALLVARISVS